jgi:DNA-binding transcriptional LysR family regulator
MELQHLRCFVILVQELNFSRAAERLHMSQPHLTRAIGQLEKELGVKLLNRTTRQVRLTAAGEALLLEAEAILAKVGQSVQTVRQAADRETERLGIAFTEMALHGVLPQILTKFRHRFPKVQIDVIQACTEEQVEALRAAKTDIGFLHPPLRVDFLYLKPIYQERLAIALPADRALVQKPQIELKSLADETFIMHPRDRGPVLYDRIIHLCQQTGFSPKVLHLKADQTFIGLITAGVGVCFVPPSIQQAVNPGVVFLPIVGDAPTLELAMAWRRDPISDAMQAFLDVVEETIG